MKICGGRKSYGGICHLPAGHQTVHKGVGRCRFHEESDPVFPYKFQSKKLTTPYGMCRDRTELYVFSGLDRSPKVLSYTIEPFAVRCTLKGKHFYMPDILVKYSSGERKLVEIKSSLNEDIEECSVKYRAGIRFAERRHLKYEVWVCKRKNGRLQKEIYDSGEILRRIKEVEKIQAEMFSRMHLI